MRHASRTWRSRLNGLYLYLPVYIETVLNLDCQRTRSPVKLETPRSSPVKFETPRSSPVKLETPRGSPVKHDRRAPSRIQDPAPMTPPNGRRTWTTHSGPLVRHTKTLPSERNGVPVCKEDVSDDKFPDVRVVIAESVKAHKAAAAAAAEREREAIEYIVISVRVLTMFERFGKLSSLTVHRTRKSSRSPVVKQRAIMWDQRGLARRLSRGVVVTSMRPDTSRHQYVQ